MEKVTKPLKSLKASSVMRLNFFAKRFGIPVNNICWGVLVSDGDDCDVSLRPVVIIKGEKVFIDILNDRISHYYNICGCKQYAEQAVKTKIQNGYLLKTINEKVEVKDEDILDVYRSKVFSEMLAQEASKFN